MMTKGMALKVLKIIVVSVAVFLALLIGGSYTRNKAVGPEGWAMDNTMAKLKIQLKDPDSMAVRSSYTVSSIDPKNNDKVIHICGLVDGKNSFGAYSGPMRFVSRSVSRPSLDTFDTYEVIVEDPSETAVAREVNRRSGFENVYWDPVCEGNGLNAPRSAAG